jgi:tetratricopeptide (TPR) repeat protein
MPRILSINSEFLQEKARRGVAYDGRMSVPATGHFNLANALFREGRLDDAVSAYRRALDLDPRHAEACNNLANALKDLGQAGEALSLYERAATLRSPVPASTLANKALLLMEMGEVERSLQVTEQTLNIDPACVPAWHIRAQLKRFSRGDTDIQSMEELLASAPTRSMSRGDQIRLEFALGKALLDAEEIERAFAHYQRGNRLKRETFAYDDADTERWLAEIARVFTPELLRKFADSGHRTDRLVFVVGMPRSGTTLVEQILASHPEVHGAGELRVLPDLAGDFPRSLQAWLTPADLSGLGRAYEGRAAAVSSGRRLLVDKLPANFPYVGLIRLILPDARVIHVRRDAVDTCLSCYTKTFRGDVRFAYDLRELGLYYRHYETLMAHWRALMPPERFIEVCYEDVVADLEREARRLVAFCGLRWSESCREFHATRRQIQTASATQVIRPIYRTSIGRSKRYAPYLGPLLAALESGGSR